MSINVDSLSLKSFDTIWYMQELKVISLKIFLEHNRLFITVKKWMNTWSTQTTSSVILDKMLRGASPI